MDEGSVSVRAAKEDELPAVMGVLDGAVLDVDPASVEERVPEEVLVAATEGRILGALVLDGEEVEAVAVRRRRRDQGIGTALVEAAADRRGVLTAEFDGEVRPFYEALGFEVEPVGDGRFRGRRGQDR